MLEKEEIFNIYYLYLSYQGIIKYKKVQKSVYFGIKMVINNYQGNNKQLPFSLLSLPHSQCITYTHTHSTNQNENYHLTQENTLQKLLRGIKKKR